MMTLQYIVALAANAELLVGTKFNHTTLEVSLDPVMKVEYVAGLVVVVKDLEKL